MAGFDAHKNLAISTVAVAPSPPTTGTSLTVPTGEGSRFATPPFNATVCAPSGPPTPLTAEVVRVTGIVGDTLTYLRIQEGTTARAILVGDLIYLSITAKVLTDIESGVNFPQIFTLGTIHADGDISTGGDVFAREITASQAVNCQDLIAQGTIGAPDANLTHIDADTITATTSITSPLGQFGGLGTTPLNATQVTSGTLPDARLSANVQLKPIPAADLPAHATRHQSGGADPVTVTALAGYPGGTVNFLRADGSFATPATGVPAAHHLTHETGGTDAVVNLSAAVLTSGTLPDARLSANVALENVANVFTASPQQIGPVGNPALIFSDSGAPADARVFRIWGGGQQLRVDALNDAQSVVASMPLMLTRQGNAVVGNDLTVSGTGGNVACKNQANTFTQNQSVNATLLTSTANAGLYFQDTASLSAQRAWGLTAEAQVCYLNTYGDNWVGLQARPFTIKRSGEVIAGAGVYDHARGTAMGDWIAGPGYFTGGFTGTYYYALSGHSLHLVMHATHASFVGGASATFGLPFPAAVSHSAPCQYYVGAGWLAGSVAFSAGGSSFQIFTNTGANWPAAATQILINLMIPIQ